MYKPFTTRYSVRDILLDKNHWDKYKLLHSGELRLEQVKEVDSMLLCGDPSKGFFCYYCSDCDKWFTTHLSCNSRFCSRCGKRHVDEWAEKTVKRMLDVDHYHIIFTMPDDLWLLIKDDFDCIKELSAMTYRVVVETMGQSAKKVVVPGLLCSIQTYGKDLKYNVHFHTVVTQGGMMKDGLWGRITYLPYFLLRIKWKLYVLDIITKHAKKTFDNQELLASIRFHRYHDGFNVRVIKSEISKKELVAYIARYVRHPPISDRRIMGYDGETVTIVCEDKQRKWYVRFSVEEFITRLIQHIPKKNFKMIRYYGLYSRKKSKKSYVKEKKQESITKYIRSKHSINCPSCGKILEVVEYFPAYSDRGPPSTEEFGKRITDWLS